MTIHMPLDRAAARYQASRPVPRSSVSWLQAIAERARQRRHLAALDDRLLSDVGITRRQAADEAGKPFWR